MCSSDLVRREAYLTVHRVICEAYLTVHRARGEAYLTVHRARGEAYLTVHRARWAFLACIVLSVSGKKINQKRMLKCSFTVSVANYG